MSYYFLNYNVRFIFFEKKKVLLIWCKKFIFQLLVNSNYLKINKNINLLSLNKSNNLFLTSLQSIVKKKLNFFSSKIKFVGRGFKIEKKKKKIQFNFTKTFKPYFKIKKYKTFKIKKNKIIFISKLGLILNLKKIFIYNIFSKKGLRLSVQIVKSVV